MQQVACPNCHFPKVSARIEAPRRGQGTALAMGATGPVAPKASAVPWPRRGPSYFALTFGK